VSDGWIRAHVRTLLQVAVAYTFTTHVILASLNICLFIRQDTAAPEIDHGSVALSPISHEWTL